MEKEDKMMFTGVVEETCKDKFTVRVNENYSVLCTLSGKIRMNEVRIMVADKVDIVVSEYDTGKGRIVYRHRG